MYIRSVFLPHELRIHYVNLGQPTSRQPRRRRGQHPFQNLPNIHTQHSVSVRCRTGINHVRRAMTSKLSKSGGSPFASTPVLELNQASHPESHNVWGELYRDRGGKGRRQVVFLREFYLRAISDYFHKISQDVDGTRLESLGVAGVILSSSLGGTFPPAGSTLPPSPDRAARLSSSSVSSAASTPPCDSIRR